MEQTIDLTFKEAVDHLLKLRDRVTSYWKFSFSITIVAIGWFILATLRQDSVDINFKILITVIYSPVICMSWLSIQDAYMSQKLFIKYFNLTYKIKINNLELKNYFDNETHYKHQFRNGQSTVVHLIYFAIFIILVWVIH